MSAFLLSSICPLFQPASLSWFSAFIHLPYHPPPPALLLSSPLLLFFLHWFSITLYDSPSPLILGPTGTVCCARELFAQLLLLPEDVASKKKREQPLSICRVLIPGRRTRRRTEMREVRHKDEKAKARIPSSNQPSIPYSILYRPCVGFWSPGL